MGDSLSRDTVSAASAVQLAGDSRIEWLDFLRGAAALAVALFHVRVTLWVGWRALMSDPSHSVIDRAAAWLTLPFPFFGSTVMLFFIVSGFAIHYPYARANSRFAVGPYGLRRFFRIYPTYLAAVILTIGAERVATSLTASPVSTWSKAVESAAMVQNYAEPPGQMAGNPSLWSLPVEIELYLVYPLMLWVWRRTTTRTMLLMVGTVSAAAAATLAAGYDWPMGNFAKYWIIWASGAVLASQVRNGSVTPWRRWFGVLLTALLCAAVGGRAAGVPYGYEHFVWAGIYYLVTLWGLNQSDPLRWLPGVVRRAGAFLGDISYSLYLIHFPLFLVLGSWWMSTFGQKPASVLVFFVATVFAVGVAAILWRLIERPSQSLGRVLAANASASRWSAPRTTAR